MVDRKLSVHFTDPTHTYPHTSFSLEDSIRKLIRSAKHRIHLVSYSLPAFNKNWYLHDVIEGAVQKGIKLTVHANDKDEVFNFIARHRHRGAEGFSWVPKKDNGLFHIKAIMVDGARLYMGSANLSENAITNSAEWGFILDNPEACVKLERYLAHLHSEGRFEVV